MGFFFVARSPPTPNSSPRHAAWRIHYLSMSSMSLGKDVQQQKQQTAKGWQWPRVALQSVMIQHYPTCINRNHKHATHQVFKWFFCMIIIDWSIRRVGMGQPRLSFQGVTYYRSKLNPQQPYLCERSHGDRRNGGNPWLRGRSNEGTTAIGRPNESAKGSEGAEAKSDERGSATGQYTRHPARKQHWSARVFLSHEGRGRTYIL